MEWIIILKKLNNTIIKEIAELKCNYRDDNLDGKFTHLYGNGQIKKNN